MSAPARPERSQKTWSGRLDRAFLHARRTLTAVAGFSLVINVLMLTGPLYMLQIYDRVLVSRSVSTLVALSVLVLGLYGFMGLLEFVRSRVLVRVGMALDRDLGVSAFEAGLRASLGRSGASGGGAARDLDTLRQFLSGPGPVALFDAPWAPLYLLIIFLLHPLLGLVATAGAAVMFGVAVFNSWKSARPLAEAAVASAEAARVADSAGRGVEAVTAMGMTEAMVRAWRRKHDASIAAQATVSDRTGLSSAMTRTLRLMLQSAMLGCGAWLALRQEISPGVIVAGSIITARALAPVELAVAQWRQFGQAALALRRLRRLLTATPEDDAALALPRPAGRLTVSSLSVVPPGSRTVALHGLNFAVEPGEALGVLGASSAGKSSLARTLVGVWKPRGGSVRLDGSTLDQWSPSDRGRYLGYLPQDVQLFEGSVADNIRRLDDEGDDAAVVKAAQAAGLDAVIRHLPDGYQTHVDADGANLSAGMRQRIGLARALYGDPALVVLDEPNAHLDDAGEQALLEAIVQAKARGQTLVVIAHRPGVIAAVDKLLILDAGAQRDYGPRDQIIGKFRLVAAPGRRPAELPADTQAGPT